MKKTKFNKQTSLREHNPWKSLAQSSSLRTIVKQSPAIKKVLFFASLALILTTCQKEHQRVMEIKTIGFDKLDATSVELKAMVSDLGQNAITAHGWCFYESNVDANVDSTNLGPIEKTGDFSISIKGLKPNTLYYAKPFMSDGMQTLYGKELSIKTPELIFNINSPLQNAIWLYNKENNIEWERNFSDSLSIELYQGNNFIQNIYKTAADADSYIWEIPETLTEAVDYNIVIKSVKDSSLNVNSKLFSISNKALPELSEVELTDTGYFSLSCSATIVNDNGVELTARGFCWGLQENPDTTGTYSLADMDTETFTGELTGLSDNTTYYLRAYAKNAMGIVYSKQKSVSTLQAKKPTVSTGTVGNISWFTAQCIGEVANAGGANITARGICWGTDKYPSISGPHSNNGTEIGSFTAELSNLEHNTTYYLRAYATNSKGTAYGEQKTFTSLKVNLFTTNISNLSYFSATCGGNLTEDAGFDATALGLCWATEPNPTIADSCFVANTLTGSFDANLINLTDNTSYYVRAYATNSDGTAYGNELSFITDNVTQNMYFDNFENGLANWSWNGNWGITTSAYEGIGALTESPAGNYGNNWNQYIELNTNLSVTIQNSGNFILSYWLYRRMESCCDHFRTQISINGGNWQTISDFSGDENWKFKTFDLSGYLNIGDAFKIRFEFTSDYSVTSSGVSIDNLSILF